MKVKERQLHPEEKSFKLTNIFVLLLFIVFSTLHHRLFKKRWTSSETFSAFLLKN